MKNIFFVNPRVQQAEVVATFGEAKLVKLGNGRFELHGGRPEDQFEAQEWVSLFGHEIVLSRNAVAAEAVA